MIDCNYCPHLNLSEQDQNMILVNFGKIHDHVCDKFGKRLYHAHHCGPFYDPRNHDTFIAPCEECPEYKKRTLRLTLKKKWFDMIASGEKKEEYRERKPYWVKRLKGHRFDLIEFRNGYGSNAPSIVAECGCISIRGKYVHEEWGEPTDNSVHFVIEIHEIVKKGVCK